MVFAGTVLFAGLLLVVTAVALNAAIKSLEPPDDIASPEDVVDRLGALTHGQVFTPEAKQRALETRRKILAVQAKERALRARQCRK